MMFFSFQKSSKHASSARQDRVFANRSDCLTVVLPRQTARHGWGLPLGNLCDSYGRLHPLRSRNWRLYPEISINLRLPLVLMALVFLFFGVAGGPHPWMDAP